MLPRFAYVSPSNLDDAVHELAGGSARIHAGGTDLLGCLHDGVFGTDKIVSLSRLDGLRKLRETSDGGLALGARLTLSELVSNETIRTRYPGLAEAAASAASPQLRHQGTVGGNLCQRPRCWYFRGEFHCAKKGGDRCYAVDGENRYHAIFGGGPCYIVHPSDTAPMLLALGATVVLLGPGGGRTVALEDFFELPADNLEAENVLRPDEIVTEILVPPTRALSSYRKIRERAAWDFALTSVALAVELSGERVERARLVLGGVAPIPWRSKPAEAEITGKALTAATARAAARAAAADAEPLEQNSYKVALVEGVIEASLLRFLDEGG